MNGQKLLRCRPLVTHVSRKNSRYLSKRYASSAPDSDAVYDVVCVGGGPAGLSLLAGLRKL